MQYIAMIRSVWLLNEVVESEMKHYEVQLMNK